MFGISLIDVHHFRGLHLWRPVEAPARRTARGNLDGGENAEAIEDRGATPRGVLAIMSLLDLGHQESPSLNTPSDLPDRASLGMLGLLGPEGPDGGMTLADASPRDLLRTLSLMS